MFAVALQAIFDLKLPNGQRPSGNLSHTDYTALLTAIRELPSSRYQLSHKVSSELKLLLDKVIEVPLPNQNRQHDVLFMQRLLRQLSGVDDAPKQPWMSMVGVKAPWHLWAGCSCRGPLTQFAATSA